MIKNNKTTKYPFYSATVDKKTLELKSFIKITSAEDELNKEGHLDESIKAIQNYGNNVAVVTYGLIHDPISPEMTALDLSFSDEHVKDLIQHTCNIYFNPSKNMEIDIDHTDPSELQALNELDEMYQFCTTSMNIMQFSKMSEDGKLCVDLFTTNRQHPKFLKHRAISLITSILSGERPKEDNSMAAGKPTKIRLSGESEKSTLYWDPIIIYEKKAEIKVSSEDGMLDAVKNILEQGS